MKSEMEVGGENVGSRTREQSEEAGAALGRCAEARSVKGVYVCYAGLREEKKEHSSRVLAMGLCVERFASRQQQKRPTKRRRIIMALRTHTPHS